LISKEFSKWKMFAKKFHKIERFFINISFMFLATKIQLSQSNIYLFIRTLTLYSFRYLNKCISKTIEEAVTGLIGCKKFEEVLS